MCAQLTEMSISYATATEDMDTVLFGTGKIIRNFFASKPMLEINPLIIMEKLNLNHDQLIDLGILLGTDFCSTITRIGPIKALALIKEYGSIEEILKVMEIRNDIGNRRVSKVI